LQGANQSWRAWRARLAVPVRKKHERTEYLRARLEAGDDGVLRALPVERQGSAMMAGVAEADALIVMAETAHALAEGDVVDVLLLPGVCR
jgi:molybdopterin molybdotransferase